MLHRTGLRVLVLLLLLSAVATPVIAAGPGGRLPRPAAEAPGFVATLWHALTSLFAPLGSLMDPDGLAATAGTCRGESGSIMDPNGCPSAGNQAGVTPDLGSLMDPNG
jgi:hypothetical protein